MKKVPYLETFLYKNILVPIQSTPTRHQVATGWNILRPKSSHQETSLLLRRFLAIAVIKIAADLPLNAPYPDLDNQTNHSACSP